MASSIPRHRESLVVLAAAALWFLPAVWWGLPREDTAVPQPWGPDEITPWGVSSFLDALRGLPNNVSPQYPLFHYWVLGALTWACDTALSVLAKLGFPGMSFTAGSVTLLGRLATVLMAAGTVAAAWVVTLRLTQSGRAAALAAAALATSGPMIFYARTSNVDVPSLFWFALALVAAAGALRRGLTFRRALVCGVCAGLGTATKDQQYAVFLALGLALLVSHVVDVRRTGSRVAWPTLATGLAAGALTWIVASGVVLMPAWFAAHVSFILRGSGAGESEGVRQLAGFYGSVPATLGGYALVLGRSARQVVAALGPAVLLLAAAGVVHAFRRDRRLLLLLLVPIVLLAGVILPVRFVLPRFLLPALLVACVFAGIAVAAAEATRWRRTATVLAAAGLAWSAVRGLDLTWQMLKDARYDAGEWIARHVQPGDTVGHYGARLKLPAIPRGVSIVSGPLRVRTSGDTASDTYPQLLFIIPQQTHEVAHEWNVPDSVFRRLLDGSLGYVQVLAVQAPGLVRRPVQVAPFVNPPVRLFARRDVVDRLTVPPRILLPDPPPR
jgi:hypothetical protein